MKKQRNFWAVSMGILAAVSATVVFTACSVGSSASSADIASLAPMPASPAQPLPASETAIFAGGCFWGVEAVFEHIKGVADVRSGYAGGEKKTAKYDLIGSGTTGHAESVQVVFDPSVVTYPQLLAIFFSVVHDPTQLNYQGPDRGTQYRSAIFYTSEDQKKMASEYIDSLTKAKTFSKPIVTELTPLQQFYEAEKYHQDYLKNHPNEPYIVRHDQPKVAALKKQFPDVWRD